MTAGDRKYPSLGELELETNAEEGDTQRVEPEVRPSKDVEPDDDFVDSVTMDEDHEQETVVPDSGEASADLNDDARVTADVASSPTEGARTLAGSTFLVLFVSVFSFAGMAISAVALSGFLDKDPVARWASVGLITLAGGIAWLYAIRSYLDFAVKRRHLRQLWRDVDQKHQGHIGVNRIQLGELCSLTERLETSTSTQSIKRMFDRVCAGARDRRLESISVLMEPVKEESQLRLLQLKSLQQLAIHLGILGTFVGLIIALGHLDLSGDILRKGAMGPLFSNIQVAFATSLAGLVVAILTALLLMGLRGLVRRFHVQLEKTAEHFIALTRKAETPDAFLTEFQQIEEALREASRRIDGHSSVTSYQTKTIHEGLNGLVRLKVDLDALFGSLANDHEAFLGKMRLLYESVEPDRLVEDMHQSLDRVTSRITDQLGVQLSETARQLSELGGLTESLAKHGEQQVRGGEETRRAVDVYQKGLAKTLEDLKGVHAAFLDDLDKVITQHGVKLAAHALVKRMVSRDQRRSSKHRGTDRHLGDR